jgi:hypothetical protein
MSGFSTDDPFRNAFDERPVEGSDGSSSFATVSGRRERLGADGHTYPIGFIHLSFNPSNGHALAGMLIADNTGLPLEFNITTAVRPTRAQQILYGNRLRSYVAVHLCAQELIKACKTRPQVIFVEDESLLEAHKLTDIPVLVLRQGNWRGGIHSRPEVIPPKEHPEYADIIDLTSLDSDMLDAFARIEKCREVLATKSDEFRI